MYISRQQLVRSLKILESVHPFFGTVFLAMKKQDLPVGNDAPMAILNFTAIVDDILNQYYKPLSGYTGYYSPFKTSNKANRWQGIRYSSTTLQRITVDTFGGAFFHPRGTQYWVWKSDYVAYLGDYVHDKKVSVFDLAVWLYRQEELPEDESPFFLIDKFLNSFNITEIELESIFNITSISTVKAPYSTKPLSDSDILSIIGYPTGAKAAPNGVISELELIDVGPGRRFQYQPAQRLNLITGNNSLGKTFLFDCLWWAMTKKWPNNAARPRQDALAIDPPRITYTMRAINGTEERKQRVVNSYDWQLQGWKAPKNEHVETGIAVYARFDGSFIVWDANSRTSDSVSTLGASLEIGNKEVWRGLSNAKGGMACNGLIRDWVTWQITNSVEWKALEACLRELSPNKQQPLTSGTAEKISVDDDQDIPVILMPYGPVPVTYASAGVQRILGLAYMMVWAWFRHRRNAEILDQKPQFRIVLLIDEAEAHLHPQWQRTIVPALMAALKELDNELVPQIHLATHSPLVMASAEVVFDEQLDDSHHLRMTNDGEVVLEELLFSKKGTANSWLADEFDIEFPRSIPAENAIRAALSIQMKSFENISVQVVKQIDKELHEWLGERDAFWPRWLYFAKQFGIEK